MRSTGTSHNLGDLILLLIQFELNQEFCEHVVDSVEGDVRISKLMLGVESIPDVANGSIVLRSAIHGLDDERYNSSRVNILPGFDAQVQAMLHFFKPFGCLIKGGRWNFWRCEDLLLHSDFIDVWREDQLFHHAPHNELRGTISMSHTGLRQWLWNNI